MAKRNRKRTRTVNIQISFLTWLVEFSSGFLFLFTFMLDNDINIIILFFFFDIVLLFVLIPGAYILNTEAIKALFIESGWFSSLRSLFMPNRVQPIVNNEAAVDQNHQ